MSLYGLHAGCAEVIPDFDSLVVACSDKWFICSRIEINIVDSLFMSPHRKGGGWRAEGPHFDRAIEARGVAVLWVAGQIHDIMGVSFVDPNSNKR